MADYDIPAEVFEKERSAAFQEFYENWFEKPLGLLRHEVDTSFLNDLTDDERILAKNLLRRNLRSGHSHIIEGVALLNDRDAISILRTMLSETVEQSRRLTIAGSLWKLDRDQSFPREIEHMVRNGRGILKEAHFEQIEWLRDERSIEYMIEILDQGDAFAGFLALSRLNELEDNKRYLLGRDDFPHKPEYFLSNKNDKSFVRSLTNKLINFNPSSFVIATDDGIKSKPIGSQ
jgi:hypothetical protein